MMNSVVTNAVEHFLCALDRGECAIDLSTEKAIDMFIDEATWATNMEKLKNAVYYHDVAGAILVHA